MLVRRHDSLHAKDRWVCRVAVHREAVAGSIDAHAHVLGDSTEAEHGDQLVMVVRLEDHAHAHQGFLVRIARALEVEGLGVARASIRCRVVNGDCHANLPACAHVADEVGVLDRLLLPLFLGLRSNDNLATVAVAFLQSGGPDLLWSTHQLAHRGFGFSDQVKVVASVDIDHSEIDRLPLLEEVFRFNVSLEVGVKVVLDDFSPADFDTGAVLVLVEHALRVRLAERVHVFKVAALDDQVHRRH